jgi:quercetin 2,3-dioxygenase
VDLTDVEPAESGIANAPDPQVVVSTSRTTEVGGIPVHRALPRQGRRMVGAWCFLDRFGPVETTTERAMTVGPHPHMGLHTVTWLLSGQVEHTDSLGSRQVIRPGQLNLMTAGHGIAHAEDSRGQTGGSLDGVQLWIAQPESTRDGPSRFSHHDELPEVNIDSAIGTVLVGAFAGTTSPAHVDSPIVGVDITLTESAELPLERSFEHGIVVCSGPLSVEGVAMGPNQFAFIPTGRETTHLEVLDKCRILLVGGEPFGTEVLMWWNFVARTRGELDEAYSEWNSQSARFGQVDSNLERIPAPTPFWAH